MHDIVIGNRIYELRAAKGWTISELAKAANLSSGHLCEIEGGKTMPSMSKLISIASALNVSPAEFFRDDISDNKDEHELLAAYRRLPLEKQEIAIRLIRAL